MRHDPRGDLRPASTARTPASTTKRSTPTSTGCRPARRGPRSSPPCTGWCGCARPRRCPTSPARSSARSPRPPVGAPRREVISPARWALFVVALTQLVLAAPALLLGEDTGATVHVARELGAFDLALAVGLLVAAWQPARAWGLLPVVAALGARDGQHRRGRRRARHRIRLRRGAPRARPRRARAALAGRPRGAADRHTTEGASPRCEARPRPRWRRAPRPSCWVGVLAAPAAAHATLIVDRPRRRRAPGREPRGRAAHLQRSRVGRPRRRPRPRRRRRAGAGGRGPRRTARSSRSTSEPISPTAPTWSPTGSSPPMATRCAAGRCSGSARARSTAARSGRVAGDADDRAVGGRRRGRPRPRLCRRAARRRRAPRSSCSSTEAVPNEPALVRLVRRAAVVGGLAGARGPAGAGGTRHGAGPGVVVRRGRARRGGQGRCRPRCRRWPSSGWSSRPWGSSRSTVLALAGAAVAAGSFATNGHTRAGSNATLATLADLSHLWVVAVWAGGLVLLWQRAARPPRWRPTTAPTPSASSVASPTSQRSRSCSSGSPAPCWRGTRCGRLDALTSTGYGRLLLAKVAAGRVDRRARRLQPLPAGARARTRQGQRRARAAAGPRCASRS